MSYMYNDRVFFYIDLTEIEESLSGLTMNIIYCV